MSELAPGSILQKMYLKNRIAKNKYSNFCEVGSGNGFLSKLLLDNGLSGIGFDLNTSACANNQAFNKTYISEGKYEVSNQNFFDYKTDKKFDIIMSCMVIEHLDDKEVQNYFEKCKDLLSKNGKIIVFVPASKKYWGIEDEIAGHYRRYEFQDFKQLSQEHRLRIADLCGLTYPISNILFPISNYLINKQEGYKKQLAMQEQTVLSGNRDVKFKTSYPPIFRLFLNEIVLYPLYILQRIFKNNENAMVIYCEMEN
jgi:SAM-dependent methyltransferase